MRERLVWCDLRRDWVPRGQRSRAPAGSYVISDSLDDVMNHADGQRYSSKRAYERAVRRAGCEIVGNEKFPEPRRAEPTGIAQDLVQAIRQHGG
jgi:hypothetical protein